MLRASFFKKLRQGEMKHRKDKVLMRPGHFEANVHEHSAASTATQRNISPSPQTHCAQTQVTSTAPSFPRAGLLTSVEEPTVSLEII